MRVFQGSVRHLTGKVVKKRNVVIRSYFLREDLHRLQCKSCVKAAMPDVVDISTGVEYDDILIKGKDEKKVKEFILNARK